MERLACINFESDIHRHIDETTDIDFIDIRIGNKKFNITLDAHEIYEEFNKYSKRFADFKGDTIEVILALKKLIGFLEASIGIDLPENLFE